MVDRCVLGVGHELICPFGEVIQLAENVADLRIGEQRRLGKLVFGKLELGIGSGAALDRRLAELAPRTGAVFAFAFEGKLCLGFQRLFRPVPKVGNGNNPGADILPAWLVDGHGNRLNVVETIEDAECAEGVQHHLWIFLAIHQHALAVFEVNNVEQLVRHDEAVAGSEAVRHIAGEVQPLLNEHLGVRAILPGFLDGFQNEFHVAVRIQFHFIGVVLADRAGGAHLQRFAELVFCKGMSRCTFCGSFRFSVLELQFQPGGWVAVKPAVGGGCREDCMTIRWHLSAPPHP